MNIKNRIKRLESQTLTPDSEYCECFDTHFIKMVDKVYNNIPYNETEATLPEGDYCHKCRKPVAERNLDLIDKINKIYGDASISELLQKPVAMKNV